jgi:hypothetical protein
MALQQHLLEDAPAGSMLIPVRHQQLAIAWPLENCAQVHNEQHKLNALIGAWGWCACCRWLWGKDTV